MTAERLNRIEDDMETIKELLISTARMAERNSESINRLVEGMSEATSNVDRLAVAQLNAEERLDQLTALMTRFVENAEADRAVVRGIQTENQRILQYLFGQQGEGQ
jgi:ATP phosphoribosyltransferase